MSLSQGIQSSRLQKKETIGNTGTGEKKANSLLIASEILLQFKEKIIDVSVDKMKT